MRNEEKRVSSIDSSGILYSKLSTSPEPTIKFYLMLWLNPIKYYSLLTKWTGVRSLVAVAVEAEVLSSDAHTTSLCSSLHGTDALVDSPVSRVRTHAVLKTWYHMPWTLNTRSSTKGLHHIPWTVDTEPRVALKTGYQMPWTLNTRSGTEGLDHMPFWTICYAMLKKRSLPINVIKNFQYIIKHSLSIGYFPKMFKLAAIIFLPKS